MQLALLVALAGVRSLALAPAAAPGAGRSAVSEPSGGVPRPEPSPAPAGRFDAAGQPHTLRPARMTRVPPPTEKDGTHVLTRQERHALNDILGAEKTPASRAEKTSALRADDKGH